MNVHGVKEGQYMRTLRPQAHDLSFTVELVSVGSLGHVIFTGHNQVNIEQEQRNMFLRKLSSYTSEVLIHIWGKRFCKHESFLLIFPHVPRKTKITQVKFYFSAMLIQFLCSMFMLTLVDVTSFHPLGANYPL